MRKISNNNMENIITATALRRITAIALTIIFVLSTAMTGTVAWADNSQHKTNVAQGSGGTPTTEPTEPISTPDEVTTEPTTSATTTETPVSTTLPSDTTSTESTTLPYPTTASETTMNETTSVLETTIPIDTGSTSGPSETVSPTIPAPTHKGGSIKPGTPAKTGDNSSAILWAAVALISFVLLLFTIAPKKGKREQEKYTPKYGRN